MRDPKRLIALTTLSLFIAETALAVGSSTPLVSTRVLEPGAVAVTLPLKAGILVAKEDRTLAFDVLGRLADVEEEGARVAAGDAVAELQSALEQAYLRQAELRLEEALSQLARTRALQRSGVASERALESAETVVALLRAERDIARESLAKRKLEAVFSGVLVETFAEPGEIASPGLPIARLIDLETLRVSVGLPSYQVGEIRTGSRALIRVESLGSEPFEGAVLRVADAVAEGEYLFEVEVEVPNPGEELRPGMVATVELVAETRAGALSVPVEAIVARQGEQVVFFVSNGVAYAVPVAKSRAHRDLILLPITVPFRELVLRGQGDLNDGMRVRVDDSILAPRAPP